MIDDVNFSNFRELDNFVQETRKIFRDRVADKRNASASAISLCYKLFLHIPELVSPTEREVAKIGALSKSMQMILGICYLSESGFYNLVGPLLRNYIELYATLIAIGFDSQCFIDWNNKRTNIRDFGRLVKRIKQSAQIPSVYKDDLQFLSNLWAKISSVHSHQLSPESFKGGFVDGSFVIGVHRASDEDQRKRLNLITVLCLNLSSLFLALYNFREIASEQPARFPTSNKLLEVYDDLFNAYANEKNIG